MLHFGVLEDALGAEHRPAILAVELYFLGGMHVTELDRGHLLSLGINAPLLGCVALDPHGERGQDRVIDRQVLGENVVGDLVVRAFYHLMLVKLFNTVIAEGVAARQRNRLLVIVVVWLEADSTFKNLIKFRSLHLKFVY